MNFEAILPMPYDIFSAPRLGADIVLREDATRRQNQWIARTRALVRRHVSRGQETVLASHECANMHHRRAVGRGIIARPLEAADAIELRIADAREGRRETRDLIHDLRRMLIVHRIPERTRQ